jgi:hypothetical protein
VPSGVFHRSFSGCIGHGSRSFANSIGVQHAALPANRNCVSLLPFPCLFSPCIPATAGAKRRDRPCGSMSDIEAAAFIAIVALMLALAVMVAG